MLDELEINKAVKVHCIGFTKVNPELQLMQLKPELEHWLQFATLQEIGLIIEAEDDIGLAAPIQLVPTNVNEG